MTIVRQQMTEIEESFFKTFNINKTSFDFTCNKKHCNKKRLLGRFVCLECDNETKKEIKVYPQITSDVLLNLEDILLKKHIQVETCFYCDDYYCSCTIPLCNGKANNKKDAFLEMLIAIAQNYLDNSDMDGEEDIYNQVRSLFSEV